MPTPSLKRMIKAFLLLHMHIYNIIVLCQRMLWSGLLLLVLLLYSLPSGLTVTENMRLSVFYRLSIWLIMNLHFYYWFCLFLMLYTKHEFAALDPSAPASSRAGALPSARSAGAFGGLRSGLAIVFCFFALISWNALVIEMNSLWHYVWLFLFGLQFSIMAFAFYFLLDKELHFFVWWLGFFSLLLTIMYALIQFIVQNEAAMAWAEHMSFIAYAMTFIAFALLIK